MQSELEQSLQSSVHRAPLSTNQLTAPRRHPGAVVARRRRERVRGPSIGIHRASRWSDAQRALQSCERGDRAETGGGGGGAAGHSRPNWPPCPIYRHRGESLSGCGSISYGRKSFQNGLTQSKSYYQKVFALINIECFLTLDLDAYSRN